MLGLSQHLRFIGGGRGDASGENKPEPTFEIPHDAPKVDIPEFEGGIPGIPEVRELPEYTEPIGTVPNEAQYMISQSSKVVSLVFQKNVSSHHLKVA